MNQDHDHNTNPFNPAPEPAPSNQGDTGHNHAEPTPEPKVVQPPRPRKNILPPRDPSAGPVSADELTTLAHDLSNLIDGSMRWLGLAASSMSPDTPDPADQLDAAREQINTVQATLHRMSTMVNAAMRSNTIGIGSPLLGVSGAVSIAMAIDHAVDVVRPLASQAGVRIDVDIHPSAGTIPAGPLYTVVLNGLFNAIQSIQRATKSDALDPGGLIQISASIDNIHEELVISISDDGVGLTPGHNPEQLFKHAHTTNKDSAGLGLSISRQIIEQLEGIISLTTRADRASSMRPGATMTVRVPFPEADPLDRQVG